MKAAVCHEFGKPLVVEDVDLDPPKSGEVKVRIAACAICHSDVHIIRGEWGFDLPLIAGHEAAGVVEQTGPGVTRVSAGDHVVVSLLRSCGKCRFCATGLPHLCNGSFALSTESRLRTRDGRRIEHGLGTAAFAEYVVVDQSQLAPVPRAMPLDTASLLACGVITGLGSVVNRARVQPGKSVAVIGAGGVGLNAVQGARLSGAHPIIAIDIADSKLSAAREFGATHGVNARGEDVAEAVGRITGGRMADYVMVTVGSIAAATQAFALAGTRGMVVYVGLPDWSSTVPVPMAATVSGEKVITGSAMGTTNLSQDIPWLVELHQAGKLKLDELITQRYPLERINEAIVSTESGAALRNVIVFE